MAVTVRPASDADLDVLVRLNGDVQRLHAETEPRFFKPDPDPAAVAAFFADRLARPDNHVRLATDGTGPIGYIWFEIQDRPETTLTLSRKRLYVHHLSVQPVARRHGAATALLQHAEAEARAAGIEVIAVDIWAANEPARALFGAVGFAPFQLSFGKRLMEGDASVRTPPP